MKHILTALSFLALVSCSNSTDIVGMWNVVDVEFDTQIDVNPELLQMAENYALSTSYEFKADSSFTMYIPLDYTFEGDGADTLDSETATMSGTYSLNDGELSLSYSSEYRNIERYEVSFGGLGGMKMTQNMPGMVGSIIFGLRKE